MIRDLETIGLINPFVKEEKIDRSGQPLQGPRHLVYDRCRYVKDRSPMSIYIPSKNIMFKVMRACINIKDPNKLWYVKKDVQVNNIPGVSWILSE